MLFGLVALWMELVKLLQINEFPGHLLLMLLGSYALFTLILGIGWIRGFPRWSFPYLAFVLTTNIGHRASILLVSITLVMVLILMGLWMIVPSQPWAANWTAADFEVARGNALVSTAVLWGWLVAIIIAVPALVSLLIRRVDHLAASC